MEESPQLTGSFSTLSRSSRASNRQSQEDVDAQSQLINTFLKGKVIVVYVQGVNNFGIQAAAFDVIRALTTHFKIKRIIVVYDSHTKEPLQADEEWTGERFVAASSERFKVVPMWPKLRLFLHDLPVEEPDTYFSAHEVKFGKTTLA
ncbi:MAG: hypothetical protein AAF633_27980, partial [Chloroflexota bacterium]